MLPTGWLGGFVQHFSRSAMGIFFSVRGLSSSMSFPCKGKRHCAWCAPGAGGYIGVQAYGCRYARFCKAPAGKLSLANWRGVNWRRGGFRPKAIQLVVSFVAAL